MHIISSLYKKKLLLEADRKKVAENREKEAIREGRRVNKKNALKETGENLILDTAIIQKLHVPILKKQLDYHREEERKHFGKPIVPIDSKTGNRAAKIGHLLEAVARYRERVGVSMTDVADQDSEPVTLTMVVDVGEIQKGDDQYMSDYDDDNV